MKTENNVVILPSEIVMEYSVINQLISKFTKMGLTSYKDIYIDFKLVRFLSAELSTFFGALIRNLQLKKKKIYFVNLEYRPNVRKILSKNGFLKRTLDENPVYDTYSSTIEYVEHSALDVDEIGRYIKNDFIPKFEETFHRSEINNEIQNSFKDSIFEFADNTFSHSKSRLLFLCGQYFPKNEELKFCISDIGKTIPINLEEHGILSEESYSDSDRINWAVKRGHTTKDIPESGMGLNEIKNAMTHLGNMTIISNKGFWHQNNNGQLIKQEFDVGFPGTLLHMDIKLNNDFTNLSSEFKLNENNKNVFF